MVQRFDFQGRRSGNTFIANVLLATFATAQLAMPTVALAQPAKRASRSLKDELTGDARRSFDAAVALTQASPANWKGARSEFLRAYEISKNPRVLFNVAVCEKNLGRYPQAVANFQRELDESKGALPSDEEQTVKGAIAALRNFVGTLELEVSEPGATVYVKYDEAEEEVGKTPLTQSISLPTGTPTIIVRKAGFEAVTMQVNISGGVAVRKSVKMDSLVRQADVEVVVEGAPGAMVLIDGTERGPAPYKGKVAITNEPHTFEAKAPGFVTAKQTAVAKEGEPISLRMSLAREQDMGRLLIETQPSGTTITIDGKVVGANKWEGPIAAGSHQVVVRKEGFYTRSLDIEVGAGGKRNVTATLDENRGTSWVVWSLGTAALIGSAAAVSFFVFKSSDKEIPGSLRQVEQIPVPATVRFR